MTSSCRRQIDLTARLTGPCFPRCDLHFFLTCTVCIVFEPFAQYTNFRFWGLQYSRRWLENLARFGDETSPVISRWNYSKNNLSSALLSLEKFAFWCMQDWNISFRRTLDEDINRKCDLTPKEDVITLWFIWSFDVKNDSKYSTNLSI